MKAESNGDNQTFRGEEKVLFARMVGSKTRLREMK